MTLVMGQATLKDSSFELGELNSELSPSEELMIRWSAASMIASAAWTVLVFGTSAPGGRNLHMVTAAQTPAPAASAAQAVIAQTRPGPAATSGLTGAIDIHVHTEPDSRPRSVDALEAVRQAKAAGMRALVIKNHYEYTSGLAYLVGKQVPGIEVFGGVDLNLTVGGMNPAAVEYMAATTGNRGKLVWMSTFDAENQVRFSKENRPSVRVSNQGRLLQVTKDVIAAIARHSLVLATGHVSPEEGLMLVREA
jgi:hypothetical protein